MTRAIRHRSTCGNERCYCGKPVTVHIEYGAGCGNVCDKHATAIKRIKRAVTIGPAYYGPKNGKKP